MADLSKISINNTSYDIKDGAARQDINYLTARVDNIVAQSGSTEGNSELQDIRVGFNSETYGNAGSAVRTQISEINNALFDISDIINKQLQIDSSNWEQGLVVRSAGFPYSKTDGTTYIRNKTLICIRGIKSFQWVCSGNYKLRLHAFDKNRLLLRYSGYLASSTYTFGSDEYYIACTIGNASQTILPTEESNATKTFIYN